MTTTRLEIPRLDLRHDSVAAALGELRKRLSPGGNVVSQASRQKTIEVFGEPLTPSQVVERICTDVRAHGLAAVLNYSARIDKSTLDAAGLRVPTADLATAHTQATPEFLAAVRNVRENILAFQTAILHRDVQVQRPFGTLCQRYTPLDRVGICVPGGAAAYPSTILMTAVPAQAAGVRELAVVAPPTPCGAYSPAVLAVCQELGISEVYRLGGAQAVAALAYGVEGIRQTDKIVGPGNLFVALAKKFVYGNVDIDSIAGPSEVVVIADDSAQPEWTALDLIAQAEHSPGASILISWDAAVLDEVADQIARRVVNLDRGDLARACLEEFGALILVNGRDQAAAVANEIAPEHLHLCVHEPVELLARIRHAGAVFLGNECPVALGDYVAGPSHVLPTGGTARFASGLCANDFLRRTSVISFSRQGVAQVLPDIRELASAEGLTAHLASVTVRLEGR